MSSHGLKAHRLIGDGSPVFSYGLKAHRLTRDGSPVAYRATPNRGGAMVPSVIVLHDTAGRLQYESSVNWLCDKAAKASAHLVVGRDGEIVQLAPFNVVTWHAGASSYRGRSGVNAFGIGIEIVNPGKMVPVEARRGGTTVGGGGCAWFGQSFLREDGFAVSQVATLEHGDGAWMAYTAEQIEAVSGICTALATAYGIEAITTHWEISPGRKVDPNPLFPLAQLRAHVFGNQALPAEDGCDAVTTVGVNQRRWPSLADNVLRVLPKGTRVRIVRSGVFENNNDWARWHLVEAPGLGEGWVHGAYLDLD